MNMSKSVLTSKASTRPDSKLLSKSFMTSQYDKHKDLLKKQDEFRSKSPMNVISTEPSKNDEY